MPNARQEASLTQVRRLFANWDQGKDLIEEGRNRNLLVRFNESSSTNSFEFY